MFVNKNMHCKKMMMLLNKKRKKEKILGSNDSQEKTAAGRIEWFDLRVEAESRRFCPYFRRRSVYIEILQPERGTSF